MLSRSSLETQKLELLQAVSELKLQHAALERENLELRTGRYSANDDVMKKPPFIPRLSPQTMYTSPLHTGSQVLYFSYS